MGWSFNIVDYGRKAFIEEITSKAHFGPDYEPFASRVVGNHVWQAVRQISTGRTFISLDLIAKERNGGWGNKGMSEDSGPYHHDCPLSLLAMTDEPTEGYAAAWRKRVRAHHAAKKAAPKLVIGTIVQYGDHQYQLRKPAGARRGWFVDRIGGSAYRLTAQQLAQSSIKETA